MDIIEAEVVETVEALVCACCGRPVSGRGAAPQNGKRYCSRDPRCRAARDRAAYARRMSEVDVPQEDRPCSRCGVSLPVRNKRITDHPLGRWCSKRACQQARQKATSPEGVEHARAEYAALKDQELRFEEAAVEPCVCGMPVGRLGFMHKDFRGEDSITGWCTQQGEEKRMPIPPGWDEAFGPDGILAR